MPTKILIIRFSSIGDIVLTTPIVRCLKKQIPNAEIYFLTKPEYYPIVEANPFIHQVILLEKNILTTIETIQSIAFDIIIDLHKNFKSYIIKSSIANAKQISFNKINFEKWVLVNFKVNILPQKHIVDRYFEALTSLNIENDKEGLNYFIPNDKGFDFNSLPEKFKLGYIVFSIGAQHETKKMPIQKWIALAAKLQKPIIILAGKECAADATTIENANTHVLSLCGKTSLHETASIIEHCDIVITHDTGLMHIAAAFQKPIVSIWGNTIPELGMYPYGIESKNNYLSEVKNLNCRPCSKLGKKKCPEGHFSCMHLQNINNIAHYIQQDFHSLL